MPQQIDFDPNADYYKALGVNAKATADEIKKAYRKLAKQNHPDSTGGDKAKESRFKDISNAYDVLGDAKKRVQYDDIRAQIASGGGRGGAGFPGGFPGYAAHGGGQSGQGFDLNDLFSQMFTGGMPGAQSGGRGGPRVRVEHVDFDDVSPGAGRRRGRDGGDVGDAEFESKVKASDGTWLRVDGADVYSDARISFDRAILGTVVSVATVDGKADVKIPPGTSSGKKLRLRGKGIAINNGRTGTIGDHYVTVQIDVPGDLDDDAKKQLVQLVTRLRKQHKD